MSRGTPNLVMMLRMMIHTTVVALISVKASTSTHLVKYSVAVRINDFFLTSPVVSSSGPTTSNAHIAKGQGATIEWREEEGAWILLALSWHFIHLRAKSTQSPSRVGQ